MSSDGEAERARITLDSWQEGSRSFRSVSELSNWYFCKSSRFCSANSRVEVSDCTVSKLQVSDVLMPDILRTPSMTWNICLTNIWDDATSLITFLFAEAYFLAVGSITFVLMYSRRRIGVEQLDGGQSVLQAIRDEPD